MRPVRAIAIRPCGSWQGKPADAIVLPFSERRRRRLALTAAGGLTFLLDLPAVSTIRDGDALELEDGRMIAVRAAAESLHEIICPDRHRLMRIAWHLGNRHLPTQLLGDRIRIREDHVIAEMVRGLGGTVTALAAPFDPEGGAYAGGHHHHHHHDDDEPARAPLTLADDHDRGA
jgi:urease accessory protein